MNTITEQPVRSNQFLSAIGAIVRDRVFQAMLAMIVLLAIIDSPQLGTSINSTLVSLWQMLPFFAIDP